MTRRLLVHWDGVLAEAPARYRLPFLADLPAGGEATAADADAAWATALAAARRPIALEPAPVETRVAAALRAGSRRDARTPAEAGAPDGAEAPLRASWRELRDHRRAVAGGHWSLLRDLVRALDDRPDADLVAVRLTAVADLAPVAQHAGHLRHSLALVNDVSARAAILSRPAATTLLATRPLARLPPALSRFSRVDKRRRAATEARGFWRGSPVDGFVPPPERLDGPRPATAGAGAGRPAT